MMMIQLEWMNKKRRLNGLQELIRILLLHRLYRVVRSN